MRKKRLSGLKPDHTQRPPHLDTIIVLHQLPHPSQHPAVGGGGLLGGPEGRGGEGSRRALVWSADAVCYHLSGAGDDIQRNI